MPLQGQERRQAFRTTVAPAAAAFPATAQAIWSFASRAVLLKHTGAASTSDLQYSFDGVRVHGSIAAGEGKGADAAYGHTQMWVRNATGTASLTLNVEVW